MERRSALLVSSASALLVTLFLQPRVFLGPTQAWASESGPGRRAAVASFLPICAAPLASAPSAEAEMVPPLEKATKLYQKKLQDGVDWFYFALKPALEKQSGVEVRNCLGSSSSGAHISPFETEVQFPLDQLVSANPEADEDGWTKGMTKVNTAYAKMQSAASLEDFKGALSAWGDIRDGIDVIFRGVNAQSEAAVFTPPGPEYETRWSIYLGAQKQKLATRNALGTMAMR